MEKKEENLREIAEIIENAMCEFNAGMKRREASNIKIARRTTHIIRIGLIGVTLLTVVVISLIHTLTKDTSNITQRLEEIAVYMQHINQSVMVMAENVRDVTQSVSKVNLAIEQVGEHVKVMPTINVSVSKISDEMFKIDHSIIQMNTNIASLNNNVDIIGVDMARMSHQFGNLNNQLGMMGYNVDRMAAPMKIFPFP
jgi:methyl-accepting chemotaxis protein